MTASSPQFAAIPVVGSGTPSATADNTYTAPAHAVTLLGGQGPRTVTDAVLNSTTLITSATAAFNSGDVGRPISATGVPTNALDLSAAGTAQARLATITSATNVVANAPATATGSGVTLTLGGGVGTKVEEIRWTPNGSPPILGVIPIFLYDGTTYHLVDAFQVNATPTNSATVAPATPTSTTLAVGVLPVNPEIHRYTNLWIPPTWTLVFSSTVASQLVTVTAFGLNA